MSSSAQSDLRSVGCWAKTLGGFVSYCFSLTHDAGTVCGVSSRQPRRLPLFPGLGNGLPSRSCPMHSVVGPHMIVVLWLGNGG